MDLMKKLLIGLFALFMLTGCSDISTVKTSTLEFDKSITIGDAFEKYKYFKSVKWSDLETDNGKKVVQVDCDVDIDKLPDTCTWKPHIKSSSKVIQFTINKDGTFEITYMGTDLVTINGEKRSIDSSQQQINMFLEDLYANVPPR